MIARVLFSNTVGVGLAVVLLFATELTTHSDQPSTVGEQAVFYGLLGGTWIWLVIAIILEATRKKQTPREPVDCGPSDEGSDDLTSA